MTKLSLYAWISTGTLIVFADLPLNFLFGIVFVGIMIEIDKIEKKIYPIISNVFLSSLVGWAVSFGVKHFKPHWFQGELKVFTMFITTLFAYVTVIYFLKNETIQKLLEKYLNKKFNNDGSNDT
tara:strand:+ start:24061 stop:24432 length:372 start_codon:yes stop_codon:yes gene_type:complete